MQEQSIKPSATFDDSLHLRINFIYNAEIWLKLYGSALKAEKTRVRFHLAYKIHLWPFSPGKASPSSLFGVIQSTKNCLWFNTHGTFSLSWQ